jgi:hypothetical protein
MYMHRRIALSAAVVAFGIEGASFAQQPTCIPGTTICVQGNGQGGVQAGGTARGQVGPGGASGSSTGQAGGSVNAGAGANASGRANAGGGATVGGGVNGGAQGGSSGNVGGSGTAGGRGNVGGSGTATGSGSGSGTGSGNGSGTIGGGGNGSGTIGGSGNGGTIGGGGGHTGGSFDPGGGGGVGYDRPRYPSAPIRWGAGVAGCATIKAGVWSGMKVGPCFAFSFRFERVSFEMETQLLVGGTRHSVDWVFPMSFVIPLTNQRSLYDGLQLRVGGSPIGATFAKDVDGGNYVRFGLHAGLSYEWDVSSAISWRVFDARAFLDFGTKREVDLHNNFLDYGGQLATGIVF